MKGADDFLVAEKPKKPKKDEDDFLGDIGGVSEPQGNGYAAFGDESNA